MLSSKQHLLLVIVAFVTFACAQQHETQRSSMKWGMVQDARNANVLNVLPNQSLEICAPNEEWLAAAKSAVSQWANAIGRWGYFEIKPCNSNSNLRVDLLQSENLGLNYYSARPGRIELQAGQSGEMLRALALHEFGHSFGMCDQYNGGGNCTTRGPRTDNSEVMGATSPNKLKLTAGDIEGVQAAAKVDMKANREWDSFLATNPKGPTNSTVLYARVADGASVSGVSVYISVPVGIQPVLCLKGNSQAPCTDASPDVIELVKAGTVGDRDIYRSTDDVTNLSPTRKNVFEAAFLVQGQARSARFGVSSKF